MVLIPGSNNLRLNEETGFFFLGTQKLSYDFNFTDRDTGNEYDSTKLREQYMPKQEQEALTDSATTNTAEGMYKPDLPKIMMGNKAFNLSELTQTPLRPEDCTTVQKPCTTTQHALNLAAQLCNDQLLTVKNYSRIYKIPARTIYYQIQNGSLTPITIDGVIFIEIPEK